MGRILLPTEPANAWRPLPDIVDAATRSRMMSGIRGRNTKPELLIRSGLHRMGYRFRLHDRRLPGRPDLVFASRRAVVEVKGCFWHGHECHLFRWPGTRQEFWQAKIAANISRDIRNRDALLGAGWRMAEVWECRLKGKEREPLDEVLARIAAFLEGRRERLVVGSDRTVRAEKSNERVAGKK